MMKGCSQWEDFRQYWREKMRHQSLTWATLGRKKTIHSTEDSKLVRVLSTLDLTFLGVGSTLGVGVYVIAGETSKYYAGPAVIISFLIAAIASVLAGFCYAEFGARVPKAGSAYVYSYVCVGEFIAFIIGWNLILEYVIGSASVVKALFTYFDALIDKKMSFFLQENMPMNVPTIGPYPDLFSFATILVFSVALACGAKESSLINNIFTVVNLVVVSFVIVSGFWNVHTSNWALSKEDVPSGFGNGGFAPYGIEGIMQGAARCFYGFIGFDCIATAGEEAKTPQKSIPIAMVGSLFIIFLAYFGISTVLTMILPYYLQDVDAPFPHIYNEIGWPTAKYFVTIGALCGLFSSLLGAMFPLPRIIYAMSSDGLLFKAVGKVHPRFQTPFLGTLLAGTFTGAMACIFDLTQLFTMMSLGTLLAYSMVAACVLILRYETTEKKFQEKENLTFLKVSMQLFNRKLKTPNELSSKIVKWEIVIYSALCLYISLLYNFYNTLVKDATILMIMFTVIIISVVLILLILISISLQPTSSTKLTFSVPFVPWVPCMSIFINIYLMTTLDIMTWGRFMIWMAIGLLIYFGYGFWHSNENQRKKEELNGGIVISTIHVDSTRL